MPEVKAMINKNCSCPYRFSSEASPRAFYNKFLPPPRRASGRSWSAGQSASATWKRLAELVRAGAAGLKFGVVCEIKILIK